MSEIVERTFSVGEKSSLSLGNIRGSVQVMSGEPGVIQVTAVKIDGRGDAERTRVELSQDADGTVRAATTFPEGHWSILFGSFPCEVDYLVKVPAGCSLKLNGVSNTVRMEGIQGMARIKTVSGDVTLKEVTGSVTVHTVSGNVKADHLNGSLDLDSVSADVEAIASAIESLKANTVSGNLRIQTSLLAGPYTFKSVSGDVRLMLPPDIKCSAEVQSLSGNLVTPFPVNAMDHLYGRHTCQIQGGGGKVLLHSVSGDLHLDCDGDLPLPAAASQESSQKSKDILERLDQGSLTVEQALSLLTT